MFLYEINTKIRFCLSFDAFDPLWHQIYLFSTMFTVNSTVNNVVFWQLKMWTAADLKGYQLFLFKNRDDVWWQGIGSQNCFCSNLKSKLRLIALFCTNILSQTIIKRNYLPQTMERCIYIHKLTPSRFEHVLVLVSVRSTCTIVILLQCNRCKCIERCMLFWYE